MGILYTFFKSEVDSLLAPIGKSNSDKEANFSKGYFNYQFPSTNSIGLFILSTTHGHDQNIQRKSRLFTLDTLTILFRSLIFSMDWQVAT